MCIYAASYHESRDDGLLELSSECVNEQLGSGIVEGQGS